MGSCHLDSGSNVVAPFDSAESTVDKNPCLIHPKCSLSTENGTTKRVFQAQQQREYRIEG